MTVVPTNAGIGGVPDYYSVYLSWMSHYKQTGENRSKVMAFHYARVAEDMGQCMIEEETTITDSFIGGQVN
tara:strand:- start:727 stop:939 length:213 start_codon:yes stop_codon:yes gene_type:complete